MEYVEKIAEKISNISVSGNGIVDGTIEADLRAEEIVTIVPIILRDAREQ